MDFNQYQLRLLLTEDLHPYFKLIEKNRKRLESFFTGTVSRTQTLEETKVFVEENIEKANKRLYFPYLLIDKSDNNIIGFFDIKNIDWNIPKAELGCYIDEDYAGKGLTTLAFQKFIEICFNEYEFEKLFLRTHESNTAARKVAENCGFEIEGRIRKDYKTTSGEVVDLIYYGMIK